jgi:PKD repeat protein
MRFFTIALITLIFTGTSLAQNPVFQGQIVKNLKASGLDEQFEKYTVWELDLNSFDAYVKNAGPAMTFRLKFGKKDWNIELQERSILAPGYTLTLHTVDGPVNVAGQENITFRGALAGKSNSLVSLTITHEFLYGFIKDNDQYFFIEPLWYYKPGEPVSRLVIYADADVKPKPGATCGLEEMQQRKPADEDLHKPGVQEKMMACKQIDLAIASDASMFTKYGSSIAVQNHNIGVMNNVQTNYDNEFNDELHFEIVQQFVVVPPATDPWTSSTNASTLLSSFTSWGPTGFNTVHDLGQLWTNRDFDGGTIGIAWLSAVCTSNRYHCLQDFTTNASLLRVMTSHEIGHNFSSGHDNAGSNTIMAPSVNNTNTWSTQSINTINAYYPGRPCLTACTSLQPPVANFTANPKVGCAPMTVSYTDQSTNAPTTWNWILPGGSPSASSSQNPIVIYNNPGSYNATLTVTNAAGNNTLNQSNFITVLTTPTPAFSHTTVGLTALFTNASVNANSYLWNFGDGLTSTQANPIHNYAVDGFYTVTLTAINDCGSVQTTATVAVFNPPSAAFVASPTTGCAGMTVSFTSLSSPNTTGWLWSFPGGTPSTSAQQNPVVTYTAPGVYSVTLVATNPAGSNTATQTNYITVGTIPTPGFSYSVSGNTVTFTNTSINATGYSWSFGDGNSSTSANPVHTYSGNGNFTVSLIANNDCGPSVISQTVTILLPPTAGFSASTTSGCEPLLVSFNSGNSTNATTFAWSFPGGSPSSSSAQNPTVAYSSPGTYSVTLIVFNSAGSDTLELSNYITVAPLPSPAFTSTTNGLTAFFANSSANATSYAWQFGDGATSSEANPSHTYAEDGTYTVILSATNNCGTVTTTQTVTIVTPPTAGFSAGNVSGCAPLTVQFSNESSENAASFFWEFPGGSPATSSQQNPVVTYASAGVYSATLTVTNSAGSNTFSQTNLITVTTTPVAGFTFAASNNSVNFTNTSSNASSYSWNFGDGNTSTSENPVHSYAQDGTYPVTLSATNNCGTVVTTQTVVIVTPPTAGFSASGNTGCAPLTVQFSNESSENATSFEWQFPGGSPASSSVENPVVTYEQPGTYAVTLTVSNSAGTNSTTQAGIVTVGTVPAAGFNAAVNILAVQFNNTSNASSYEWDFGDGTSSTDEQPAHAYAQEGTYTVVLTATNECGSSVVSQTVTVVALPAAAFSASPTEGCAPLTVQFNNESSENATAFSWQFPGGTPAFSAEEHPVVTYASPGVYSVSMTASNSSGQHVTTQTDIIVVNTVPAVGFSSSVDSLTVSLTNNTADATGYLWDFGDGQSSTEANPGHTYAADGIYEVTLTATNECGSASSSQQVVIVTPPTAYFGAGPPAGCAPLTVQYTNASSSNATAFEWSFPGGEPATSTEANPVVTYGGPGTYSVQLTASNQAGSQTLELQDFITVKPKPTAGFVHAVNGATASFENTSTDGTSYLWEFGDGSSSQEANVEHTYLQDGVYEVTLTAFNDCGSTSETQLVVIATSGPIAVFSAETTTGCAPLTVQFQNLSSSNAESFAWSFPGGEPSTSTEANPVVVYNTAGTYDVSLTAANGQGSNAFTQNGFVVVNGVPTVGFSFVVNDGTVNFSNTSANASDYKWEFGDGGASTEENPVYNYTEPGEYPVTLTASNECGFSTLTTTVLVVTGVEELAGIREFRVFPNPSSGAFSVLLRGEPRSSVQLSFRDVLGRSLYERAFDFRPGVLQQELSFEALPAGVYFLQVSTGGHVFSQKVMVTEGN